MTAVQQSRHPRARRTAAEMRKVAVWPAIGTYRGMNFCKLSTRALICYLVGGVAIAALAQAPAADSAVETAAASAARCRTLADGVARLSCYDRAFGVLVPAGVPAGAPAVTAGPAEPRLRANTPADFGLTAEQREQRSRAPDAAAPKELAEITARVSNIKQQRAGRFTVTFDNGQIWQQRETDASIELRIGDRVTIKKAAVGSYLLVTDGRRSTKVERIK